MPFKKGTFRKSALAALMGATLVGCGGGGTDASDADSATARPTASVEAERSLDMQATVSALAAAAGTSIATAADGTTKASGTSFGNVIDGDTDTYWQPTSRYGQRISAKGFSATVSSVTIHELTQTVTAWRLINNDTGQVLASGSGLGANRSISFAPVASSKLDLLIDRAVGLPRIGEFEVFAHGGTPPGGGEPPDDGGSTPPPSGTITGASCRSTGSVSLSQTQIVRAGQVFDGGCRTFNPTFSDGGQAEGQDPVFLVEKGGVLKNVIIGRNGADGIHIYGDATVDNITWTDVGEDALTVKAAATVTVRNITGSEANDKFFQLNAPTTFKLENAVVNVAGKLFRENGGKCYPVRVTVNGARLSNIKEAVFRSDCNRSTFSLSNAQLSDVKAICYAGGQYASCGMK
ncbi:pectate lyase [Rhizobacter sp. LjRoot28]|uniref:pectate lyase n=1 Tax=Rhizobacter sp. LjRoot28 TaxID=3342309 RepID=UPI003ECF39D9